MARMSISALLIPAGAVLCSGSHAERDTTALISGWNFVFSDDGDTSSACVGDSLIRTGRPVELPHMFPRSDREDPMTGTGWYYTKIPVNEKWRSHGVTLYCPGAALWASAYVNRKPVFASSHAYLPFRVAIPPEALENDSIELHIRVDSRLPKNNIPDDNCKGWWIYGGLIRGLYLCTGPKDRIDSWNVFTKWVGKDTFRVDLSVESSGVAPDSLSVEVRGAARDSVSRVSSSNGKSISFSLAGLKAWSPERPILHSFTVQTYRDGKLLDRISFRRGLCQLTAKSGSVQLNGERVFLRGVGRHDVVGDSGPMISRDQRIRNLVDIRQLGANLLRIAHFPQHPDIYYLCDSLGLLIMDEIPAWKTEPRFLCTPEGKSAGCDYMEAIIKEHGRYTSPQIWSIGNEFDGYRNCVAEYASEVTACIKALNPEYVVTYCSYFYMFDKAFAPLDIISINEYFGWHLASLGLLAKMLDKIHSDWPDKPVLISEFGAQSALNLRNRKAELAGPISSMLTNDLSEDHQSLFLTAHLDTIFARREFITGATVWAYNDFMAYSVKPRTRDMPYGLNSCGLVTRDRRPKLSHSAIGMYFHYIDSVTSEAGN